MTSEFPFSSDLKAVEIWAKAALLRAASKGKEVTRLLCVYALTIQA